MTAVEFMDQKINTYVKIDPFYYFEIKDGYLQITNQKSHQPKYKISMSIFSDVEKDIIHKWELGKEIGDYLLMLQKQQEKAPLLQLVNKLKGNIFISEELFINREWILERLRSFHPIISPRDQFELYKSLSMQLETTHFHFIVSSNYLDHPLLKKFPNRTISYLQDQQKYLDNRTNQIRWIIILADHQLTLEEQQMIHEIIDDKDYLLLFILDEWDKSIFIGPRLKPTIHGCLGCLSQTKESVIEHHPVIFTMQSLKNYFHHVVEEEILYLLMDEYFRYTSDFSSIIGKQFIFKIESNSISYKLLRRNYQCPICGQT
ncbi:hypothetical protein [Bacillus kwashiorkori]|uniref:hypothetical protein n=1 Tax=Bacillus kwashiorkori TaxID=1522318 RepID=UPI00078502EC|nr:hypothetical protein [Bacillus kwashiorkori]